jgi:hypothetical protein
MYRMVPLGMLSFDTTAPELDFSAYMVGNLILEER